MHAIEEEPETLLRTRPMEEDQIFTLTEGDSFCFVWRNQNSFLGNNHNKTNDYVKKDRPTYGNKGGLHWTRPHNNTPVRRTSLERKISTITWRGGTMGFMQSQLIRFKKTYDCNGRTGFPYRKQKNLYRNVLRKFEKTRCSAPWSSPMASPFRFCQEKKTDAYALLKISKTQRHHYQGESLDSYPLLSECWIKGSPSAKKYFRKMDVRWGDTNNIPNANRKGRTSLESGL